MNHNNESTKNEPTTNQKPTTNNQQLKTNNQQPTTILQFGGGVFLRAFLGSFVEEAKTRFGRQERIAIVERSRSEASEVLARQNYEYTVVAQGIVEGREVREATRIHAVSEILAASADWARVLEIAASDSLRLIVSNTTEAGIVFDESDVERVQSGNVPESFPGKLLACLQHRWNMSNGEASGVCVLPTELIDNNASALQSIIHELCQKISVESAFLDWLEKNVLFCNTLVDRIVPGTPDKTSLAEYVAWLGYEDNALITAEPYRLWAVEGNEDVRTLLPFTDCAGVVVKPNIQEERTLKVRILNAGHTLMAPRGIEQGLETVLDVMNHPELSTYIEEALRTEVALTLDYEPDRVQEYISEVLDRFRNPFLRHKLSGIRNGEEMKFKTRVQPSIDCFEGKFGRKPKFLKIEF